MGNVQHYGKLSFFEGRENEIVVWTKLVGWKVGIFVTFIKLQELHQSLYKSQINSINNKGMLDLMNKTTSRAHEFRFPVVRKFHKPERNKASECIFTISCTPSWQGWKAMKANQQLFDWWWAGCDLWERKRRRIQIKIWVIPDILQTVVVWHLVARIQLVLTVLAIVSLCHTGVSWHFRVEQCSHPRSGPRSYCCYASCFFTA